MFNRREFIASAVASTASLLAQSAYEWGGTVLDVHLHLRQDPESNLAHITGSGVTKAVLLTRVPAVERARVLAEKHPAGSCGSSALMSRSAGGAHDCRRTCARLCHAAGGELDQVCATLAYQIYDMATISQATSS